MPATSTILSTTSWGVGTKTASGSSWSFGRGARGTLGRGLVAGCGLAGALAGMGLGAVCLGTGIVPTASTAFLPLTGWGRAIVPLARRWWSGVLRR